MQDCLYRYDNKLYTEREFKNLLDSNLLKFVYSLEDGDIEDILDPAYQFMTQDEQSWINTVFKKIYPEALQSRVKLLYTIVNSDNWAGWTSKGLTLYRSSAKGSGYHEAWHEFTQLFLTKEEKINLYKEVIRNNSQFKDLNYKNINHLRKIEEHLADSFMKYMQSNGELKYPKSIRQNHIFRKIFNFLKALFGAEINDDVFTNKLNALFSNLRNGKLDNYKFSPDNILFNEQLNRRVKDFENLTAVTKAKSETVVMTKILNHFDALIANFIIDNNQEITSLFGRSDLKIKAYENVKRKLREELIINKNLSPESRELHQFIVNNFNEFVEAHIEKGTLRLSSFDKTSTDRILSNIEDEEFTNENEESVVDDTHSSRDAAWDNPGNGQDSKDVAAQQIRFLIRSLVKSRDKTAQELQVLVDDVMLQKQERLNLLGAAPSIEDQIAIDDWAEHEIKSRSVVYLKNDLGFYELTDFNTVWNTLQTEVAGITTYEEMHEKITETRENKPYLQRLLNALPSPHLPVLTPDQRFLTARFRTDMMRIKNPIKISRLTIKRDEQTNAITSSQFDFIEGLRIDIRSVKDSFTLRWLESKNEASSFIKTVDDEQQLDINKVRDTFLTNTTNPNYIPLKTADDSSTLSSDEIETVYANRIHFFKALGFMFSPDTIASSDFKSFIMDNAFDDGIGNYLLNDIDKIYKFNKEESEIAERLLPPDATEEDRKYAYRNLAIITDPLSTFERGYKLFYSIKDDTHKPVISTGNQVKDLYNLEILNSGRYFNQSSFTAAQKIQYENSLYNTFFMYLNDLNNAKKYPTYQTLIAEPELAHFNVEKNPYLRSSLLFHSLFNLEGTPTSNPNYGVRREKLTSKRIFANKEKHVTIEFNNLSGVSMDDPLGLQGNFEGENTVKLEPLDRMMASIHSVLLFGTSEMLRTADKSSANSIMPTTIFINGKVRKGRSNFFDFATNLTKNPLTELVNADASDDINNFHFIFKSYLKSELERIYKILYLEKEGQNNFVEKSARLENFGLFNKLLSEQEKNRLKASIAKKVKTKSAVELMKSSDKMDVFLESLIANPDEKNFLSGDIISSIGNYLENALSLYTKQLYDKGYQQGTLKNFVPQVGNVSDTTILRSYVLNQFVLNVEQTKLIYGDPVFFKDPFKRFAMYMSTGSMPNTSDNFINQMNNDPSINSYTRALGFESDPFGKEINTAVVQDVQIDALVSESWQKGFEILKEKGKISDDLINHLTDAYSKVEETDAQGVAHFDFYRNFKISIGFWYPEQEAAYKKFVKYISYKKGALTEEQQKEKEDLKLTAQEEALFPPIKMGYGGPLINEHFYAPAYHKYSVYPILPSMIEHDSNMKNINAKMLKEGVSYLTFESASKVSNVGENKKLQTLYSDVTTRQLTKTPFYKTKTLLRYYKEQLQIEPKDETDATFGTQFRKLLFSNFFEIGIPTDITLPPQEWEALSKEEKLEKSEIFRLHEGYKQILQNVADIELERLLEDIDATLVDSDIVITNFTKLKDLIISEARKKEAPNSVEYFFQLNEDGTLKYPIETSKDKKIIQDVLLSIVNNRLVKLKINGGGLVQAASTGHERFDGKSYSDTLKHYETKELENGDFEITPMEVEVSFIGDLKKNTGYAPLLNLKSPIDNKRIKTVERLNEAMRNEGWKNRNIDYFRLVGYRIPTQSSNSMESMVIKQFLPKGSMNMIIVPSAITKKAGSDFYIDKLIIIRPYINNRGKIITPTANRLSRKELSTQISALQEEISKFENNKKILKGDLEVSLLAIEGQKAKKEDWAVFKYNLEWTDTTIIKLEEKIAEINSQLAEVNYDIADNAFAALASLGSDNTEELRNEITKVEEELKKTRTLYDELSEIDYMYKQIPLEQRSPIDDFVKEYVKEARNIAKLYEKRADLNEQYSKQKEANFNNLLDIAKNVLKRSDKFIDLITPNSTDILHNKEKTGLADVIKQILQDSGQEDFMSEDNTTDIFSPAYQNEVYESFMQGKATLGIAALAGPLAQIFQRTGAYVNPVYKFNRDTFPTVVFLNANQRTVLINGVEKVVYDLAAQKDSEGKISKSELIAQYINAYVDIAKEPFIFYMNAGINVAPVLMWMAHLGIPAKQAAYFINQPSIRSYIKKKALQKSYVGNLTNEVLNRETGKIFDLVDTYNEFVGDRFPMLDAETYIARNDKGKITAVRYGQLFSEFNQKLIANEKEVKALFSEENLESNMKGESPAASNTKFSVSFAAFLQYIMLENQSASLREVNDDLKPDTTMSKSVSEAIQQKNRIAEYTREKDHKVSILPKNIINKIITDTEIAPYYIQPKLANMYSGLEKIQNHPVVQQRLQELLSTSNAAQSPQKRSRLIKDYFSDLTQFILQNYRFDNKRVMDEVWPLLLNDKSKRTTKGGDLYKSEVKNIVTQLVELNIKYNGKKGNLDLRKESKIIGHLSADNSATTNLRTLKWIGEALKKDSIDEFSDEWDRFANLNNPKYSDIRDFFRNLAKVVFVTYGETRSAKSFFSLVPSHLHAEFMLPFIESFVKDLDTPSEMRGLFENFFNDSFADNNQKYFRSKLRANKRNDKTFKQYRRGKLKFSKEYQVWVSNEELILTNNVRPDFKEKTPIDEELQDSNEPTTSIPEVIAEPTPEPTKKEYPIDSFPAYIQSRIGDVVGIQYRNGKPFPARIIGVLETQRLEIKDANDIPSHIEVNYVAILESTFVAGTERKKYKALASEITITQNMEFAPVIEPLEQTEEQRKITAIQRIEELQNQLNEISFKDNIDLEGIGEDLKSDDDFTTDDFKCE